MGAVGYNLKGPASALDNSRDNKKTFLQQHMCAQKNEQTQHNYSHLT